MMNALLTSVRLLRSAPVAVSRLPVGLTLFVKSENALNTPSTVSGPSVRLVLEGDGVGEADGAGVADASARARPEASAMTNASVATAAARTRTKLTGDIRLDDSVGRTAAQSAERVIQTDEH